MLMEKMLFGPEHEPLYSSDEEFLAAWKEKLFSNAKPCLDLNYCPYGPLVEDFPLLPPTRSEAQYHVEYAEERLRIGTSADGKPLDAETKEHLKQTIHFNSSQEFPDEIPELFFDVKCDIFGHLCPVFFVAESFADITGITEAEMDKLEADHCSQCEKSVDASD